MVLLSNEIDLTPTYWQQRLLDINPCLTKGGGLKFFPDTLKRSIFTQNDF